MKQLWKFFLGICAVASFLLGSNLADLQHTAEKLTDAAALQGTDSTCVGFLAILLALVAIGMLMTSVSLAVRFAVPPARKACRRAGSSRRNASDQPAHPMPTRRAA